MARSIVRFPVKTTCENLVVNYRGTKVVEVNPIKRVVTLRAGGWYTATTKSRINQYAGPFGVSISQVKDVWYVKTPNGTTCFTEGMKISF